MAAFRILSQQPTIHSTLLMERMYSLIPREFGMYQQQSFDDLSAKAMSSKAQWDSRTKSFNLHGHSKELYLYITGMAAIHKPKEQEDYILSNQSTKRAKKRLNSDFSITNKRMRVNSTLWRGYSQPELNQLKLVMGSTFGFGTKQSAYTLKEIKQRVEIGANPTDTVPLQDHHVVRLISCDGLDIQQENALPPAPVQSAENEEEWALIEAPSRGNKQPRTVSYLGFDLWFEECASITSMKMTLRFQKLLGGDDQVKLAAGIPIQVPTVAAAPDEPDSSGSNPSDDLQDGDFFVHDDETYEVIGSTIDLEGNCVSCKNMFDDEVHQFTVELVAPLVAAYKAVNAVARANKQVSSHTAVQYWIDRSEEKRARTVNEWRRCWEERDLVARSDAVLARSMSEWRDST